MTRKLIHNYANFSKHSEGFDICMYCPNVGPVPVGSRQQHNNTKKHENNERAYYSNLYKNMNVDEIKTEDKIKCLPCNKEMHKENKRFHMYDKEHKKNKLKYFKIKELYCECGLEFNALDYLAYHLLVYGHKPQKPYLEECKGSNFYIGRRSHIFTKPPNKTLNKVFNECKLLIDF